MFDDTMSPIYDDEYDIFSPPTIEDIVYVDYDMPPIYDVYNDDYDVFSPSTIEDIVYVDYSMPPIYDDYNDGCDSLDRKSTRLNSSHSGESRMPSSA